jgi:hypothetical protein
VEKPGFAGFPTDLVRNLFHRTGGPQQPVFGTNSSKLSNSKPGIIDCQGEFYKKSKKKRNFEKNEEKKIRIKHLISLFPPLFLLFRCYG